MRISENCKVTGTWRVTGGGRVRWDCSQWDGTHYGGGGGEWGVKGGRGGRARAGSAPSFSRGRGQGEQPEGSAAESPGHSARPTPRPPNSPAPPPAEVRLGRARGLGVPPAPRRPHRLPASQRHVPAAALSPRRPGPPSHRRRRPAARPLAAARKRCGRPVPLRPAPPAAPPPGSAPPRPPFLPPAAC